MQLVKPCSINTWSAAHAVHELTTHKHVHTHVHTHASTRYILTLMYVHTIHVTDIFCMLNIT